MSNTSGSYKLIAGTVKRLAQLYVKLKKPTVIAVAGSVGKTSTKLMLAHLLSSKRVSFMDDSYNNGLGLYLSVFELKIPTKLTSPFAWISVITAALLKFFKSSPEIIILEYGIDHPGDMDKMIDFIRPDISILTAVTPEHMEFMKTLDGVAQEETKILKASRWLSIYNHADIKPEYVPDTEVSLSAYGSDSSLAAHYTVESWQQRGALVSFNVAGSLFSDLFVQFVSEPLIRQLTGAALVAKLIGIPEDVIRSQLETATPAASRMRIFEGINNTILIDDTTNFSPDAGIEALKSLKRLPAKRRIAVLGNMHELGDYAEKGYTDVSKEFSGIDIIALIGDLSPEQFGPLALSMGFVDGQTLFYYDNSIDAGIDLRDKLVPGDTVLVKGPFGGFYLEETVKTLLNNPEDAQYLTRQSEFWQAKKRALFGDKYSQ